MVPQIGKISHGNQCGKNQKARIISTNHAGAAVMKASNQVRQGESQATESTHI